MAIRPSGPRRPQGQPAPWSQRTRLIFGLLALATAGSAPAPFAATIRVFAAASLTESLQEIAAGYEQQTGDQVLFNFGASSFLARQIEEGAPADIFFSADDAKMDGLARKGLLLNATRKSRLSNSLVIVVAADGARFIRSGADLADARVKRLALADPKTVPAGIYAKEYLERARLWEKVAAKVVPTANVRAALAAVESGNVDAGMVYKTDARLSRKVRVAYEVALGEGPAIHYPMAVVKDSKQLDAARRFLDHLASADAGRVFERFGFIVRP
jgi:molybdate transport system substrate-binding protein